MCLGELSGAEGGLETRGAKGEDLTNSWIRGSYVATKCYGYIEINAVFRSDLISV